MEFSSLISMIGLDWIGLDWIGLALWLALSTQSSGKTLSTSLCNADITELVLVFIWQVPFLFRKFTIYFSCDALTVMTNVFQKNGNRF